ncbi:MAG: GNAT family N-acetyltransferase [Mycobacteriales bacterium]
MLTGVPIPLPTAPDWPHADTADALRPHAEHGPPGEADGTFLIVVDDRVVGDCGWFGRPDEAGNVEIGYGLAPSVRGRGLGTHAVQLLCDWVEHQPGVRRIAAEALVGNEASRRLLLRLGFREEPAQPPYVRYVRDHRHVDEPADEG